MRVLITGANRGIGRALFDLYASRGHDVIGTSRAAPEGPAWRQLDVTDPGSLGGLANGLGADPLDVLVCNAGVYADKGMALGKGYDLATWEKTFSVNVFGVFLTVQALLPNLLAAPHAKIAIVSSQMGAHAKAAGNAYAYRASKAAAINIGKNLAVDLSPKGVAVGIYHPGWVRTDMGGGGADIDAATSAAGLADRIAALSLDTTGCFETWDGRPHPL